MPSKRKPPKHGRSEDEDACEPSEKQRPKVVSHRPSTSEAMMDDLRTDLCELGFMELVDYVHEFLDYTAANAIAIKSLNRMWRFIAMMAAHWEGAILCKCGKHMLLNPTKLQKPNAEKDAWCCDPRKCGDFCTCNIPKCLKNDDELQEERIGGYPAFEFLGIDFGVCHENELGWAIQMALRQRQPNIDNVYFESWPQDDVVAIRFVRGCDPNKDDETNNMLLERFGPRNLRLFVAGRTPISPTSLAKCTKLKWLELFNARDHVNAETVSAVVKLPQLKRLSLDGWHKNIPQESFKLLRDNESIQTLDVGHLGNAALREVLQMKNLSSLDVSLAEDVTDETIRSLCENGSRLKSLNVTVDSITDSAFCSLVTIPALRRLQFSWRGHFELRDSQLEQIAAKTPPLEVLQMNCNSLTDDGISALGKLTSLMCLTLSYINNVISSAAFDAALGNLSELRGLFISTLTLPDGWFHFLGKLTKLEVFSCNRAMEVKALSHICSLTGLRKLDVSDCILITHNGTAHLSQLANLESLNLSHTDAGNEALQHIGGLTKMRWLKLSFCLKITNDGLLHLYDMKELELLDVSDCRRVTVKGIVPCLEKLNKLRFLCVQGSGCSDQKSFQVIRERFPSIHLV